MKGNIYYIEGNCGRINGEDNAVYFFHKNDLLNCTIYQLSEGDYVEFEVENKVIIRMIRLLRLERKVQIYQIQKILLILESIRSLNLTTLTMMKRKS